MEHEYKEKILITGTGRCGTTFLVLLFSFLEYSTGFHRHNWMYYIYDKCKGGLEKGHIYDFYFLKNPTFMIDIEKIITEIKVKKVIIPVRNYNDAAQSRSKYKDQAGGYWNATNVNEQIDFFKNIMANYILMMTKYDIDTIFIDYDRMISDKKYLFNKLKDILDEKNIQFDFFEKIYNECSDICKTK